MRRPCGHRTSPACDCPAAQKAHLLGAGAEGEAVPIGGQDEAGRPTRGGRQAAGGHQPARLALRAVEEFDDVHPASKGTIHKVPDRASGGIPTSGGQAPCGGNFGCSRSSIEHRIKVVLQTGQRGRAGEDRVHSSNTACHSLVPRPCAHKCPSHTQHAACMFACSLTFLTARFMSVFGEFTVEACATRGPRARTVARLVWANGRTTATWPAGKKAGGRH